MHDSNRRGVPGDWFVDPINLGVPGVRATLDDGALAWQSDSLCAETDPEAFFPEKGGSTRDAKRICESCDVRAECLEYALKNDERFGIWGGLSERERRKLRKSA
ncbi:WhiB family transcriptional regulator [Humidisolicoccus flavus]|uniref:WhiB family transcriptional regulator n=1 Tax=Humidisolicoccus flavus TaxID=3111414 RepID=UPI0032516772